ncbi:GIY-YIG nuclease family protein [Actinopolymorpha sp. B9G3]|uniref:GIY-YIG nuclease family protein n=1 Tax=Actinopolymorpha sp. B9G3 TaxID=3158970 RepID=UPI0032D8E598
MNSKRGVLYVLSNPHMPGLVKIGRTTRDPLKRAREISRGTGVPADFEVMFDVIVSDIEAAERETHLALQSVRVSKSREFFRIAVRDAIKFVQDTATRFPVHGADANNIELLPMLEERMRRWLRREIVSVVFAQFSDLCVLKVTTQPSVANDDGYQAIHDLRVLGDHEADRDLFDPRDSLEINVVKFLDLDAYSMEMVGLGLLNTEASEYVCSLIEDEIDSPPLRPSWRAASIRYEMWGSAVMDNSETLARLRETFETG